MLKPVVTMDPKTHKEVLFVVPETELEEKFIIWFTHRNGLKVGRCKNMQAAMLPSWNDSDTVAKSMNVAYQNIDVTGQLVLIRAQKLDKAVRQHDNDNW